MKTKLTYICIAKHQKKNYILNCRKIKKNMKIREYTSVKMNIPTFLSLLLLKNVIGYKTTKITHEKY